MIAGEEWSAMDVDVDVKGAAFERLRGEGRERREERRGSILHAAPAHSGHWSSRPVEEIEPEFLPCFLGLKAGKRIREIGAIRG